MQYTDYRSIIWIFWVERTSLQSQNETLRIWGVFCRAKVYYPFSVQKTLKRNSLVVSHEQSKMVIQSQIWTVTWLDFWSGATLNIRTFESYRMTQHSRNQVTWSSRYERGDCTRIAHWGMRIYVPHRRGCQFHRMNVVAGKWNMCESCWALRRRQKSDRMQHHLSHPPPVVQPSKPNNINKSLDN